MAAIHRPRQPGASLARRAPPRIIEFEPIPSDFTPRRPAPFRMDLSEVVPPGTLNAINAAGRMAFHCVGDTGGIKRPEAQSLVARGMEQSLRDDRMHPAFCYHLGDVIYYNGEVAEYWPQFYEPYQHYALPIIAIPGNHDGELKTRQSKSLLGFYENFVAAAPGTFTHESRDSGRPAMNQPWFYWTLVTPYATFVGLYTNVPEHGRLADEQRMWFQAEMRDADPQKALIVALHHPVYSFDNHHSGSPNMAQELQVAINASRRVPNMVLTAHVHNYQRIELQTAGLTIPFFVIGNGGYWNLHYLASAPGYADPETGAKLISAIDSRHGFMTFEISSKVINGHFTTVPRPQESWSDPNAYNAAFDVFSYPATPMRLPDSEDVVLIPASGSHLAPQTS
jgi:calcineurin-like phosphoesterase family protein